MAAEQNKAAVRRLFYELLNRTNLAVADEIVAPGYVDHDPVDGGRSDRGGLKALSQSLRTAFPDGHFTISEQVAVADRVVTRWAFWGTQFGPFAGRPASGETVWLTAISIHRLVDGLIEEGWTAWERRQWGRSA
jgi:steroid delta-isomerase-like uncharacterized protein